MKDKAYPDIPEMPSQFIDWIIGKNIVIFAGAGISALCKYPLWDKLANNLITHFREIGYFDYQIEDSIKNGSYSPIQKITILSQYIKNGQSLVIDKICDYLVYDKEHCDIEKAKKVAYYLFSFDSLIVTTNADLILDNNDIDGSYSKFNSTKELPKNGEISRKSIVHLHGSINDKENLIFTESQYAENYLPSAKVGETLTKVIKGDRAILFIGYSLREFELLKYFIDPKIAKEQMKIFKLEAYFHSQEKTKLLLDSEYYEALGVQLLPYFIDENGYDALLDVLDDWTSQIKKQISPSGDLYIDFADAIMKKPTRITKQFIISKLNVVDPFFIQEKINQSKYYKEWINTLWNYSSIFNPVPYFTDGGNDDFIVRSFWSGLIIVRDYTEKNIFDKSLEPKITTFMKKVASLIKKLKTNTKNSELIASSLFDIAMRRTNLINEKNIFDPIACFYMSKEQYGAYMFAERIIEMKKNLIAYIQPRRLFSIVHLIATSKNEEKDHFKILKSQDIESFILSSPIDYYLVAMKEIRKTDWRFTSIGSFANFSDNSNNFQFKEQMYAKWLIIAAKQIESKILIEDIHSLIKSRKAIFNKIGICLLGVRLEENIDIFKVNIDLFFNKYCYAADLIQLLKNNIDYIRENKELQDLIKIKIEKSTFGCNDQIHQDTIRKTISNILAEVNNGFEFFNLSSAEREFIDVIDNSASFYSIDINNEVETIYQNIKDASLESVINYINNLQKGRSFYFDSSIYKAIDKYLEDKDYSTYKDHIKDFGNTYLCRYICNSDFVKANNDGALKFIYLYEFLPDEEKAESMMSILYTCSKMIKSDEIKSEIKNKIIDAISYKLIPLPETDSQEIKIGTVINSPLHLYWSILYDFCAIDEVRASKTLLSSVEYFYNNCQNNKLLKGIMASWFSFIYYYESTDKKEDYFNYVFNEDDSFYSYKIFSYINGNNTYYINKLCSINLFISFILNTDDNGQERVSLATRIVLCYLFDSLFEDTYGKIINNGDIETIEGALLQISKNKTYLSEDEVKNRFISFLDGCINSFKKYNKRSFSVNQILEYLKEITIAFPNLCPEKMWELLSLIPDKLSYYHDDSIIELITYYKETSTDECILFLDSFFKAYNHIYFYDKYIVNLFDTLTTINHFKKQIKRWLAMIGNKNPALYVQLSKSIIKK